ncbi:hypothetical protein [Nonomuraea salmonea]|uniref:hypothetical protein n=1 Tax=Nonomuraea salmonea TaxID=46181 RepID=UPI0031EFCA31
MAESRAETDVYVVEPLLPQRLRRPSDLLRFIATLLVLGAVILLALVAKQTLIGLEADVKEGAELVPLLSRIAAFLGGAAVLIVPVAFAVERVFHRDGLRVAEGLIAAIVGMAGSFLLGQWLVAGNMNDLRVLLTGGREMEPLNTLLTSVVAYATAVRISRRPTWRMLMWTTIALYILAFFSGRQITIPSAIVTVLVGMAIGYATLYGVGSPNTRPPGSAVVAALRKLSFSPVSARRVEDDHQGSRRYAVGLKDGSSLDVTVLDRDRQVAGLPYRLWRRIRLNSETRRRAIRSLRAELEREALMAYAAQAAGASTPPPAGHQRDRHRGRPARLRAHRDPLSRRAVRRRDRRRAARPDLGAGRAAADPAPGPPQAHRRQHPRRRRRPGRAHRRPQRRGRRR